MVKFAPRCRSIQFRIEPIHRKQLPRELSSGSLRSLPLARRVWTTMTLDLRRQGGARCRKLRRRPGSPIGMPARPPCLVQRWLSVSAPVRQSSRRERRAINVRRSGGAAPRQCQRLESQSHRLRKWSDGAGCGAREQHREIGSVESLPVPTPSFPSNWHSCSGWVQQAPDRPANASKSTTSAGDESCG
jgi:hypothetical protein